MIAVADLKTFYVKHSISDDQRGELYSTLVMLLENNVLLIDALNELLAVASDDGAHPNKPVALLLASLIESVSEGRSFAASIRPWVSAFEAEIIAAGERSGNLGDAFTDALSAIRVRKTLIGTVVGKALYPFVLLLLFCGLLYVVSTKLVPSLATIAPPDDWTGSAGIMYAAAQYATNFGLATAVVFVLLIVAIIASFSRLTGTVRYYLDRYPPWSVYRRIVGALMLKNVAVLIRSGVTMHDALTLLATDTTPYLRERLNAALVATTQGLNFGEALIASQFDFPDAEANKYLRVMASRQGFDRSLVRFSEQWIERTVKKVGATMNLFFIAALLLTGAAFLVILDAGNQLQDLIDTAANSRL